MYRILYKQLWHDAAQVEDQWVSEMLQLNTTDGYELGNALKKR